MCGWGGCWGGRRARVASIMHGSIAADSTLAEITKRRGASRGLPSLAGRRLHEGRRAGTHRAPSAMAKHSVRMWSATTRYAMSLLPLSCTAARGRRVGGQKGRVRPGAASLPGCLPNLGRAAVGSQRDAAQQLEQSWCRLRRLGCQAGASSSDRTMGCPFQSSPRGPRCRCRARGGRWPSGSPQRWGLQQMERHSRGMRRWQRG